MSEEIMFADGFEDALLGIGVQFNKRFAIYDYDKCIKILVKDGMTEEEALEWMDFNVIGAYVGENTPVFLMPEWMGEAVADNPELSAGFVRSVIEAMNEPREDATPFAIRESRIRTTPNMKKRLQRMQMFRRASLREYEAFVWRVYTRPRHILANDLPFFLKRQAE